MSSATIITLALGSLGIVAAGAAAYFAAQKAAQNKLDREGHAKHQQRLAVGREKNRIRLARGMAEAERRTSGLPRHMQAELRAKQAELRADLENES